MKEVAAAVFYGVTSLAMTFLNKAIISRYKFDFPSIIFMAQMLVVIGTLLALGRCTRLPHYTPRRGVAFLTASMMGVFHGWLSLKALQGMNIPMYGALKRCTPLVNLILSVIYLKNPWPSNQVICSILLITVGCFTASLGDVTFDSSAYFLGTFSVLVQGFYQTLIQKASEADMSSLLILQLNAYNSLPMYAILALVTDEFGGALNYPQASDTGFLLCMLLLAMCGGLLNYSLYLCTAYNSALTTSLVGILKSVLQTILGFFILGGVPFQLLNVIGLFLNLFGACLYTYSKFREKRPAGGTSASSSCGSTNSEFIRPENKKILIKIDSSEDEDT